MTWQDTRHIHRLLHRPLPRLLQGCGGALALHQNQGTGGFRSSEYHVHCPLSTVHCPGEQLLWHPLPRSGPRAALAPLPLRLGHVRVKLQAIIEAFHQNNTSIFSVIDKLRKLLHLLRLMWRWEGGQLINRVGGKLALVNRSEGNSFKPWAAMRKV